MLSYSIICDIIGVLYFGETSHMRIRSIFEVINAFCNKSMNLFGECTPWSSITIYEIIHGGIFETAEMAVTV